MKQPVKFGQGKHIRITKKNLTETPSLAPSSYEDGGYSALDQQTKTQLTGHNGDSLNS